MNRMRVRAVTARPSPPGHAVVARWNFDAARADRLHRRADRRRMRAANTRLRHPERGTHAPARSSTSFDPLPRTMFSIACRMRRTSAASTRSHCRPGSAPDRSDGANRGLRARAHPSGFSFEASLTILASSSPISRASSEWACPADTVRWTGCEKGRIRDAHADYPKRQRDKTRGS